MSYNRLSRLNFLDMIYWDENVVDIPGVYIFYKTKSGPPRYVGRADTNLYRRMKGRHWEYKYYRFKHCETEQDAYHWECIYWHKYQDTIDNSRQNGGNHPANPKWKNIYCPICDF
ncbi:MAG: hypothetical protein WC614_07715 [bacterium]